MKWYWLILSIVGIVILNIAIQHVVCRVDMTQDHRYSISAPTKQELKQLDESLKVDIFLNGNLNAGFLRLQNATSEMLEELSNYGEVEYKVLSTESKTWQNGIKSLRATEIYEKDKDGRHIQTLVYPYARLTYKGKSTIVNLLRNNSGLSGAENLNISIEELEFTFAEAIHRLRIGQREKVVFLEGHQELPEMNTLDLQQSLSRYFDVYYGAITDSANCLDPFKCVIVADPSSAFSEHDKYILDQYIMHGGRVLWVMNGVRFSNEVLTNEGFTPVLPIEINLQDMLFKYGVRINAALVQDIQCLPIPVDVSSDPTQPHYQSMPWMYAPLLLTSSGSPVTKDVMQVSSSFTSYIDLVGDGDSQERTILLATSSASRVIPTPAEVNLMEIEADAKQFGYSYLPVCVGIDGVFESIFAHRMVPEGVISTQAIQASSVPTKQIFVASGSIIRNEVQNGEALPLGYDRYTKMQFGNRDFLTNAVLYLADDEGIISLRQKSIAMRLLNEKAVREKQTLYKVISIVVPILLLGIVAASVLLTRKKRYTL